LKTPAILPAGTSFPPLWTVSLPHALLTLAIQLLIDEEQAVVQSDVTLI